MIIKQHEVDELIRFWERQRGDPYDLESEMWPFYAARPHLMMPMGFDEHVSFKNSDDFRRYWFASHITDGAHSIYRRPSGQWLLLVCGGGGHLNSHFAFDNKKTFHEETDEIFPRFAFSFTAAELLEKLEAAVKREPEILERTLWSPKLWTPTAQDKEQSVIHASIGAILRELQSGARELQSIMWKELEEIVAELLRAHGLKIHVVRESPQGGRDIVARGVLVPGEEPLTMAIEVKHKAIVDRPDVEKALWQNRAFPALMFITSGRFTAGVLREKQKPENQLRLFLKDGDALGDLIRNYPLV